MQKVIKAGLSIWEETGMEERTFKAGEKEGQEMAEDVTSIKGVHIACPESVNKPTCCSDQSI